MADEVERRETVVVERDSGAVEDRRAMNPLWVILAIVAALVVLSLLFGWPFGGTESTDGTGTGTNVPTSDTVSE